MYYWLVNLKEALRTNKDEIILDLVLLLFILIIIIYLLI